jgi:CBS domain-containing protein
MNICSDVMTSDPICCLQGDTVVKLAQLMGKNDIGLIPIIDSELTGKISGIVTNRDLALKVVAEGRDPKSTKAGDVMTRKVLTVNANDDLQKAFDMMTGLQLRRIPVVDHNNRVVGILAQADVSTRLKEPQQAVAVVKGISQTRGGH